VVRPQLLAELRHEAPQRLALLFKLRALLRPRAFEPGRQKPLLLLQRRALPLQRLRREPLQRLFKLRELRGRGAVPG
jgi:hypothetical protein